jgi:DNA-binding protein HU-beta
VISTKSLEEQWQLLGALEALPRIASVRTDRRLPLRHGSDLRGGAAAVVFLRFKRTWVTRITGFWHNPGLPMTKTELQSALAEATQTDKRTAGVFLDTLSDIAYKEIKKTGEFVLPGFGKLVKQKRKARTGFNPKTQQKIKIPAKTVVKFRVAKAAKDGVLGVKK